MNRHAMNRHAMSHRAMRSGVLHVRIGRLVVDASLGEGLTPAVLAEAIRRELNTRLAGAPAGESGAAPAPAGALASAIAARVEAHLPGHAAMTEGGGHVGGTR